MIVWVAALVLVALILMVGIERLLRRLGVQRQLPHETESGVRDLLARVDTWQRKHAERRNREPPSR